MSKIIGLKAQNWMRIEAVDIKFTDSGAFVIGGENDQGKSAVLKLVQAILGGRSELPAVPVRVGETKALGELTIGDEEKTVVATLSLTDEGGYKLKVCSANGVPYKRPATMLADMVSAVTFDPLAILDMAPKEQRALFFGLAGLDFDELDGARQGLVDERKTVGRDVTGRKRAIEEMPHFPDAPIAEVTLTTIAKDLEDARANNQRIREATLRTTFIRENIQAATNRILSAQERIAEEEEHIKNTRAEIIALRPDLTKAESIAANTPCDTESITAALDQNEQVNAEVRTNAARALVQQQFNADHAKYEDLTEAIKEIDAAKKKTLADATFPVDGLEFPADGGVLYKGLPLDQDSGSGQTIRAVEIAAAMNPELRTMLVDGGEQLGAKRLKVLHDWACEHDYQIIMARVSTGPECSIIIEDGAVKEHAEELEAASV